MANFGAQGLGRAASFLPDLNSALKGARNIYSTLDRKTKLDVYQGEIPNTPMKGNIEFRNVHFAYPTRKSVAVLRVGTEPLDACLLLWYPICVGS